MIVDTKTDLNEAPTPNSGPVTIDDVRLALGDSDANATNANKIRAALGRGSQSTIQKHLDLIRAELAAASAPALESAPAPEAPKELAQAIWSAAWTAAQAKTAGALAQALAQQQALVAALAVAQADAAAAQQQIDDIAEALAVQQTVAIAQSDEHINTLDAVQRSAAEQQRVIDDLRSELAQQAQQHAAQQQQAQHAQALAEAKAESVAATLRGELDRHVSQLADLRAALGKTEKAEKQPEQGSIL